MGELGCKNGKYTAQPDQTGSLDRVISSFGITVSGNFSRNEKWAILKAARLVGDKFAKERQNGETAADAFVAVYNGINFKKEENVGICGDPLIPVNNGGCTDNAHDIRFWSMAGHGDPFIMMGNVIHELGHAYSNHLSNGPEINMPYWMYDEVNPGRALFLQPNSRAPVPNPCDDCYYYQYNRASTASETFADMFVAWNLDVWNTSTENANVDAVRDAKEWMDIWMP